METVTNAFHPDYLGTEYVRKYLYSYSMLFISNAHIVQSLEVLPAKKPTANLMSRAKRHGNPHPMQVSH